MLGMAEEARAQDYKIINRSKTRRYSVQGGSHQNHKRNSKPDELISYSSGSADQVQDLGNPNLSFAPTPMDFHKIWTFLPP